MSVKSGLVTGVFLLTERMGLVPDSLVMLGGGQCGQHGAARPVVSSQHRSALHLVTPEQLSSCDTQHCATVVTVTPTLLTAALLWSTIVTITPISTHIA